MEAAQELIEQRQAISALSAEIDNTARQQAQLRQDFFHINQESFKELSDLCNTYFKTEGRSSQANSVCAEVRGLMKELGIGEQQYPSLERRINEQFDHVMDHFRSEHPGHREQFFQTACYLFAGFKTRTIALLLRLSEQDVYQTILPCLAVPKNRCLRPFLKNYRFLFRYTPKSALEHTLGPILFFK